MRKIQKTHEPDSFTTYKRNHPTHQYKDLCNEAIRQDIRQRCTEEQYYLCAYCCKEISGTSRDTINEHIQPRNCFPNLSMDFNNIVASCNTTGHCDNSKDSQIIHLTPLMNECETEFEFRLNGEVVGKTERAKATIDILKLNHQKLCGARKQAIDNMLYSQGLGNPIDVEDDELLQSVCDDITKLTDKKLQAFIPIVVNAIKNWINQK